MARLAAIDGDGMPAAVPRGSPVVPHPDKLRMFQLGHAREPLRWVELPGAAAGAAAVGSHRYAAVFPNAFGTAAG